MVDPSSSSIERGINHKPTTSPETIPVNAPDKVKAPGTKKTSFVDPAQLDDSLQELDEAVASIAAETSSLHHLSSCRASQATTANDGESQMSGIDSTLFDQETNFVIDNMEKVARGFIPSIARSSDSRRSRASSRSSRRGPRGLSLERLISETILKTASSGMEHAHFSLQSVDSETSSQAILKDLKQTKTVLALETATSSGSGSVDSGQPPTAQVVATVQEPSRSKRASAFLLPHIETEDDEPSLLPPEWEPDWSAAAEQHPPHHPLPDPPALNKSSCTEETDPETPNTSAIEKPSQEPDAPLYSRSFFDEGVPINNSFPQPTEHRFDTTVPEEIVKDWSPFEESPTDEKTKAEIHFDTPRSMESPSSIVKFIDHQLPNTSFSNDEWAPWLTNQASF